MRGPGLAGPLVAMNTQLKGLRLLFLITEDWYFWSHREPLARAARDAGAEVILATRVSKHRQRIEAAGYQLLPISFDRSGTNPLRELRTCWQILRAVGKTRPDIVHQVGIKPILYGSVICRLLRVPYVVNAIAGLGFLYISESRSAAVLRGVFETVTRWTERFRGCYIIQNADDADVLRAIGVRAHKIRLVSGSGVDTNEYRPMATENQPPIAVCACRMLWDKGIGELVQAAQNLHNAGIALRIQLVGPTDANPSSITRAQLDAWTQSDIVEVLGPRDDIAAIYRRADIGVLPSYREGMPKSLLEAASCGLPLVATDVPGCREICKHEQNGLLVPAKDVTALTEALAKLAGDKTLREKYGQASRALIFEGFSLEQVVKSTLQVYKEAK